MPNGYARLTDVKAALRVASTAHDAALVTLIEDVSRWIDRFTGRRFYSEVDTRYFQWRYGDPSRLWLTPPSDLLNIYGSGYLAADTGGDFAYATQLTQGTDYWLGPEERSNEPYTRVDLIPTSTTLTAWPTHFRGVQVSAGVWGYSNEWELVNGLTWAEAVDGTETAIDVSDGTLVDVGDTLGEGSSVPTQEQMEVTAISSNTLTVVRGINGTGADTHDSGDQVYRRVYNRLANRATILQVGRLWKDSQVGDPGLPVEYAVNNPYLLVQDQLRPLVHPFRRAI